MCLCGSGQFLNDVGRHADAAESYLTASSLLPDDFELVFNTASALRSFTTFSQAVSSVFAAFDYSVRDLTALQCDS